MLNVSDLSEEQISAIKNWVAEGEQMADIQKHLVDDFGFNVTYMDTRFLSLDLGLEYHQEEQVDREIKVDQTPDPAPVPSPEPLPDAPFGGAQVTATLDQVARPGAMVSGTVTFSDGMKGQWMIDEMGRPSIDPDQPGYQPTEEDLVDFQQKLRSLLDGHV